MLFIFFVLFLFYVWERLTSNSETSSNPNNSEFVLSAPAITPI